jgi:hypothetical protein
MRGDIRSSRLATGILDTGGKWKKSSIRKNIVFFVCHQWQILQPVSLTPVANLPAISKHQRNWWQILPPVSLTPVSPTPVHNYGRLQFNSYGTYTLRRNCPLLKRENTVKYLDIFLDLLTTLRMESELFTSNNARSPKAET